jgi:benzoyl-CoA reductase/2-hydroxyglutaryl-CoA dehydratase subunit BcrC/BadD/HgdB
MGAVDFFGKTVNRNFRRRPRFTRGFLRFGYAAQQQLLRAKKGDLRLPSQVFLEQLSMRAVRRALADPSRAALVNMFAPAELLHAMGLAPLCAEGFSSYLSGGRCERGFLDYAAERGVPETYCSYHRALLGAVLSGLLARPRFIVTSSSVCDANTNTFRTAAAHYGMDEFYIDVPCDETPGAVAYVRGQLESLVSFLEDGTGRRMERDELVRAVRNTNATVDFQRRFYDELARRDFPNYISAEMHRILAGHNLIGTDGALAFFRMQYEDILACPVTGGSGDAGPRDAGDPRDPQGPQGPRDPRGDRKRVLWCHVLPYYVESLKEVFNHDGRLQLLASDMNFDQLITLDEDDPLGSMARRLIVNHFNGGAARRAESVTAMARKLRADAAIIFCHWGCKHSNGGAFLLRDALTGAGIKTLILDGDAVDRRGTNEAQLKTRLQAFLEILGAS